MSSFDDVDEKILDGKWILKEKLTQGGFGVIWIGKEKSTGKEIAVKLEKPKAKAKRPIIRIEILILKILEGTKNCVRMLDCGEMKTGLNYIVMDRIGDNLGDLRREQPFKRFDLGTAIRAARQILAAILDLHTVGFIHRDIKPSNFCIGRGSESEHRHIYMVDFGLARRFVTNGGKVRYPRHPAPYRGTLTYCSIFAMQHMEQERRDDLIALLYMLVEFLRGDLPWRADFEGVDRSEIKNWVCKKKMLYRDAPNLFLSELPVQLFHFHAHIYELKYGDDPLYEMLDNLLLQTIRDNGILDEDKYNWEWNRTPKKTNKAQVSSTLKEDRSDVMNSSNDGQSDRNNKPSVKC